MQFMPATAARFGLTDPYEPKESLLAAARYVKYLGRLFDWKLESVLAAYNSGEGTVSAYLQGRTLKASGKVINSSRVRTEHGVPPYKETIGYVSQGVKVYRWLEKRKIFAERPTAPLTAGILSQKGTSTAGESKETQPVTVFYDPRTGKRRVTSSIVDDSLRHLEFGPVIVGPSIPTTSTKQARSTFAGPESILGNR